MPSQHLLPQAMQSHIQKTGLEAIVLVITLINSLPEAFQAFV